MSVNLIGAVLAAAILLPVLLQRYIERLPVAPACPSCSFVTRPIGPAAAWLQLLPALATTFVGECARCGWRGRMRWRWSPRRISRTDR